MTNTRLAAEAFSCVFLLVALGCSREPLFECEHTVRGEKVSTDGKMKAAIVDVQCGATTRDASWVLLTSAGEKFHDEKDRIATFDGSIQQVLWEEQDLVVVHGDARPAKTTESVRNVHVVYRTK
jgi:hypothetical protein